MNRISKLFNEKQKNILSIYFTTGYPHFDDTLTIIKELETQGADMVEIGIPFSDPMADGPVIQQSGTVALNNGMTLKKLFAQLEKVRDEVSIPLIMMGYLNPVMQFGLEAFCSECKRTGVDGIIIPDLPFNDYIKNFKSLGEKYGLEFIMLITPETSEERIRLIDENTSGFIYMVSTASTTGAKDSFDEKTLSYFRRIDGMNLKNPRLIGFGISNKTTLDAAFANAGGAIIGSEFIRLLGSERSIEAAVTKLMQKTGKS
ncbi:MAG: tryptophan synthase subunit alpha [Prevotellaceae bacterium]|jgi:tryptophan synthase alpha chain|nr:tryptophan synthase subunit alpha [Prevotellaceae bacterium]